MNLSTPSEIERLQDAHDALTLLLEKLKESDRIKTQFYTNVSHELRTPLALILGPAEQLLDSPKLGPEDRRNLEVIVRNARILLHRVNDLLDVAKLEAGKMAPDYVETNLARLVRVAAGHFDALALEKRIGYVVEAPEVLRAHVDPDKFLRVLLNLLTNAFKFAPAEGRVRCSLRGDPSRDRAVLEIADSGAGIPPDQRPGLFERYPPVKAGSTRRFGGTGLGLAISRDFVELHGGTISIADAPEGGALFVVEVPLLAPADTPLKGTDFPTPTISEATKHQIDELRPRTEPVPAEVGGGDRPCVLIVEDNRDMNRFLCDHLAREYRIASALSASEGLEKATALRPDLILTDLVLPGMTGEELVQAIRSKSELNSTPIVLLTAMANHEVRVKLLREGAQDYILKPFLLEELHARVDNLVRAKVATDQVVRLNKHLKNEIAERKRLEIERNRMTAELLQGQKLQAIGQLAAGIAHEINNPVGYILSNLSTVGQYLDDLERFLRRSRETFDSLATGGEPRPLLEELAQLRQTLDVDFLLQDFRQALKDCTEGGIRIREIVKNLKAYSHVDEGEIKTADLNQELENCLRLCWNEIKYKAEVNRDYGKLSPVRCYPQRINQVFVNLLVNAVQAIEGKGEITVSTREDDGYAIVRVRDTGKGIAPEHRGKIFEPFFTTKPVGQGTGLGLHVAYKIVKAHNGKIEVWSEAGRGTEFIIRLPLCGPEDTPG